MTLYVTGRRTTIVREFSRLHPDIKIRRLPVELADFKAVDLPDDAERLLLCAGLLRSKKTKDQASHEIAQGLAVNLVSVMQICEAALHANNQARICVIGSESGYSGSYDGIYSVAKAGLHHYIETRRVGPYQQLVGIAPTIIWDSGMTQRRDDKNNIIREDWRQPRGRYLDPDEVARVAYFLLYEDSGFTTNTMIRINGGMHAR